jgi:hypothetical protein
MVMDDLGVRPLSTCSLVTLLTQFSIKEIGDIEVKVVDVGMDEVFVLFFFLKGIYTLLLSVFYYYYYYFNFTLGRNCPQEVTQSAEITLNEVEVTSSSPPSPSCVGHVKKKN